MTRRPGASKYFNLDVIDDLGSRTARRRFISTFVAISLAMCLAFWSPVYFSASDNLKGFMQAISGNLLSASLLVLIVYGAYIYYIQEDIERPEVETLRPGDINQEIKSLPCDTSFYFLWGRSATYFRAETLRSLDEYAKKSRKTVEITVLLPDPEIPDLARAYEGMMVSLGDKIEKDKLFKSAVSTAAACALISAQNRNLKIKLCYSKFLPSFRIDMSEQGAILTEDDKSLYGLRFSRRSQFFEMFRTMMIYEMEISRVVDLTAHNWRAHIGGPASITIDALLSLGFSADRVREHRDDIIKMMEPSDHRYK